LLRITRRRILRAKPSKPPYKDDRIAGVIYKLDSRI
jgi:hypothetical protein